MAEKKKICVVDDDKVALSSLEKLLVLAGFEVDGVSCAKEAVDRIRVFKPQIILLDLLMPNLGGLEVCEILNADKETQNIPIIVTSALAGQVDIEKAYRLGVTGYFTKPYDFQKLLREINKTIAYKQGKF
jgi:CheY-like chemotaxis protein